MELESLKCYSILLDNDSNKSTAKGVNKFRQSMIHHELYKSIHDGEIDKFKITCPQFVSKECVVHTTNNEKTALTPTEVKRYWRSKNRSFAYGHPDAKPENIQNTGMQNKQTPIKNTSNIKASVKKKIVPKNIAYQEKPLDLTYKKRKICQGSMFQDE